MLFVCGCMDVVVVLRSCWYKEKDCISVVWRSAPAKEEKEKEMVGSVVGVEVCFIFRRGRDLR